MKGNSNLTAENRNKKIPQFLFSCINQNDKSTNRLPLEFMTGKWTRKLLWIRKKIIKQSSVYNARKHFMLHIRKKQFEIIFTTQWAAKQNKFRK